MAVPFGKIEFLNRKGVIKTVAMSLVIALVLSYIAIMVGVNQTSNVPAHISYVSHATISINGNADFATQVAAESWSGDGSPGNPFIITGYDIDASSANGIDIRNANVHFIVRNCYVHDGGTVYSGILLETCANGAISDNNCSNNNIGIYFGNLRDSTVRKNNCSNNHDDGIYFGASSNSTISNNICNSNNNYGIYLWSASNNTLSNNICNSNSLEDGIWLDLSNNNIVSNNICHSNHDDGIWLQSSLTNTVSNNDFSSNHYGIYLSSSSKNNTLFNNNCSSNIENGILLDTSCNNNILSKNNCSNNEYGIDLDSSSNNTLSKNNCSSNNKYGMELWDSNNNILSNNICISNNGYGIILDSASNYNTISNNNCSNSAQEGIDIWSSSNNNITGNQMYNNLLYGVDIVSGSSNNRIWNNNFAGNNGAGSVYSASNIQAIDGGTNNWWNSTSHYGNYWGDWTTPDAVAPFGIVDVPYDISGSAGAKDYYPLTQPADIIPPVTTASLSGTQGDNGWYRSNVTVSLSAIDTGSGVYTKYYRIGTSGSWSNGSFPFEISSEGSSMVEFYSIDKVGNTESEKEITIKIDKTSPILSMNQTAGFEATVDYAVISWIGLDGMSGIERFEVKIDGGSFASVGMAMSHNFSGLVDGVHNVTVKAIDKAGNEYNKSIQFTVNMDGLMLYIAIIVIIVLIILAAIVVIMIKKKRSPPMRLIEMKAEPPVPPAV